MMKIDEALSLGTCLKAINRKFGVGKNKIYAIRKPNGELTYNRREIIKVVEEFYGELSFRISAPN